ncbi:hypothetical protein CRE_10942 [Caenorhabditis remanei]|uniref:Uncharacterized protein n=1 Tax=Caenorhabditis remanei TaxID=31234 RepID=E3M5N1_CAERE|nr:hypothetical protein CRE_10942 [Caenorhabditis remanei]
MEPVRDCRPMRILYLPIIILYKIMLNLTPVELIDFSLLSNRCRIVVKSAVRRDSFELWVRFLKVPRVEISTDEEHYDLVEPYLNRPFQYLDSAITLEKYFEKYELVNVTWAQVWTDYICNTLNCDIEFLDFNADECPGSFPAVVEWLKNRQLSIPELSLEGSNISSEDLSIVFRELEITNSLDLSLLQKYEVRPDEFKLNMNFVAIEGYLPPLKWVTLDSILASNCVHFYLGCSEFTDLELNRFLKEWVKGSNSRMKCFSVGTKQVNREALTDGLTVEGRDESVVRTYENDHMHCPLQMRSGTDIRNCNERLGTFKIEEGRGDFKTFTMINPVSSISRNGECLQQAIAIVKPGVKFREIGNVIQKHANANGFSVVKGYCGHGIHRLFHTAPNVPHYAKNNATGVMKAGNSFTIEPMINAGTFHDDKWPYDWTAVTVHYLISSNSYFNKRDQNRPWFMDQIEQKY